MATRTLAQLSDYPDADSKPMSRASLSEEQLGKLESLINHFNRDDFELPTTLKALKAMWKHRNSNQSGSSRLNQWFRGNGDLEKMELRPLDDVEKCYWSREAFLRCLRACKWHYDNAVRRAEETCVWRREYNVEQLGADSISVESETGKELVYGFDRQCRPVLYMHPYRQNTQTGPRQIDFVVWSLERTIDLCPPTDPATEMLCLCIDFGANRSDAKSQPTSLGQARKVLEILQTYYCERLGRAICINVPSFFWAFYKLVGPFVDPVTKEKIRFLEKADATEFIPANQLQSLFGGDVDSTYRHDEYFPALTKLCQERKAANLERWRLYGEGKCGLSETVIRGASSPEKTELAHSPAATIIAEESAGRPLITGDKFVDAQLARTIDLEQAVQQSSH